MSDKQLVAWFQNEDSILVSADDLLDMSTDIESALNYLAMAGDPTGNPAEMTIHTESGDHPVKVIYHEHQGLNPSYANPFG